MPTISVPTAAVTRVLSRVVDAKVAWFQNFNTDVDFYLIPAQSGAAPAFTTSEFKLNRAADANTPGGIILDSPAVVSWDWYAYQASGTSKNLVCGQWLAPSVIPSPAPQ